MVIGPTVTFRQRIRALFVGSALALVLSASGFSQPEQCSDLFSRSLPKSPFATRGPGISRILRDGKFDYFHPNGTLITNLAEINRIQKIGIPPAHENVWISPDRNSPIQSIGVDSKGRLQYRYSEEWNRQQAEKKFNRIREFGNGMDVGRAALLRDAALPGLPERKVMAAMTLILETGRIRVGSEEYTEENGSFGLSTLERKHVRIQGPVLHFEFDGKSGVFHNFDLPLPAAAATVAELLELPGTRIFQFLGAKNRILQIDASRLNEYIRQVFAGHYSAKDFRTWAGTITAARMLMTLPEPHTVRETEANISKAVDSAADQLRNTPSVCRSNYIHPTLFTAYKNTPDFRQAQKSAAVSLAKRPGLKPEEALVLEILHRPASIEASIGAQLPDPSYQAIPGKILLTRDIETVRQLNQESLNLAKLPNNKKNPHIHLITTILYRRQLANREIPPGSDFQHWQQHALVYIDPLRGKEDLLERDFGADWAQKFGLSDYFLNH